MGFFFTSIFGGDAGCIFISIFDIIQNKKKKKKKKRDDKI